MNLECLKELRKKISLLDEKESKQRDLYLKGLAEGTIQGPLTGVPSIDKVWLKNYRSSIIEKPYPKMTMVEYNRQCNKDNLDNIAITYFGNKKITYREYFEKIEETKKAFAAMGVKKGDVVMIAAPFLPEIDYCIYALNDLGAVSVPVDPRVPALKLKDYILESKSKFLVAIDICCNKINEIIDDTNIEKAVYVSAYNSLPVGLKQVAQIKDKEFKKLKKKINADEKGIGWNKFIENGKSIENVIVPPYEPNTDAIIIYTSGTSGAPKGAISTNESYNNMAYFQTDAIITSKIGDKFLLIMPPFIAYGAVIGLHGQHCTGQNLIMVPTFNIDNQATVLGKLVKKHKPQTIMGVPTFMSDLIKHPAMQNLDCSFLKNIIVGGDSMIISAEDEVNKFFAARNSSARIRKGWGMTEVNSCFSYTRDDDSNKLGSVGIPLLGNNIRILKPFIEENGESKELKDFNIDDYEELSYGKLGECFVKSPTEVKNYLNNEEASSKVFFTSKTTGERWIRTEDLGRVDSDGNIFVEGRMKRIIIRPDGHNISPFAIEDIINKNPKVKMCSVVGKPSDRHKHGSFAIAYVVLKEEYEQDYLNVFEELKKQVAEALPPRDVASNYELTSNIPLTPIGKVDYKSLEKLARVRTRV